MSPRRLESLADPGGIMVSETVFNLTNRHLAFGYDFAGEQKVKGQDEPIAGYRVRMPGQNSKKTDETSRSRAYRHAFAAGRLRPAPATAAGRGAPVRPPAHAFGKFRAWFGRQTRSVRGSMAMIAMFATINLLTNGFSEIWFIYPSIPFAFSSFL